ncbi:hypothetical protein [Arthrobacter bambusae]|uniref:hypothetical protein n=1 Tax=Arthrobacter bambusae TaxID=1338426 RepID=UPI00278A4DD8|nr:hypothetical protein [Arthrobacter bambusae]MDQ0031063.1 hypothetical protein [Arthrobacter bambusae]MDQ0098804.1 hypothetical protein [Arthrobacter bambusae]
METMEGWSIMNAEPEAGARLEIRVDERADMDQSLNTAVDRIIPIARRDRRHGILVTRLGEGHFTIELSDTVPYGYTEELDNRNTSS